MMSKVPQTLSVMLIIELMLEMYLNKHVNIKQCNAVHSENERINLEH